MLINNFAQFIILNATKTPNKIAVIDDHTTITYAELASAIKQFAYRLKDQGITPGTRVMLSMGDSIEWPVAFLACLYVGAVPVMSTPTMPQSKLLNILKASHAQALITDLNIQVDVLKISKSEILTNDIELDTPYNFHPDEICLWSSCSGTTGGEPKYVVHRHASLQILLDLVANPAYEIDESSRVFSTAKMTFLYGMSNSLVYSLGQNATSIVTSKIPAYQTVFDLISEHDATHLFSTPSVLTSLLKNSQGPNTKLKSLRAIISSGEPLPLTVARQFKSMFDQDILDALGMSEVITNFCTQTLKDRALGTIGKPVPGVICEVRDSRGRRCDVNEIGMLYVNHPCQAIMYWNNWEKSRDTFRGPWVKTGDMVYQDKDGNFVYAGRNDNLVKINGLYVSPTEIENLIISHPDVIECLVSVVKDQFDLLEINADIVVNSISNLTAGNLRRFLAPNLESHMIPRFINFVETLPKTITNKKIRYKDPA